MNMENKTPVPRTREIDSMKI